MTVFVNNNTEFVTVGCYCPNDKLVITSRNTVN